MRYNLEKKMRGRRFSLDYVYLLGYKFHKINPNYSASYKDCTDWIKNKKSSDKCYQYKRKRM